MKNNFPPVLANSREGEQIFDGKISFENKGGNDKGNGFPHIWTFGWNEINIQCFDPLIK